MSDFTATRGSGRKAQRKHQERQFYGAVKVRTHRPLQRYLATTKSPYVLPTVASKVARPTDEHPELRLTAPTMVAPIYRTSRGPRQERNGRVTTVRVATNPVADTADTAKWIGPMMRPKRPMKETLS